VLGTDLGIPVEHGGNVWFFFGDTVGYKAIWPFGESHPDAVAYVDAAAFDADPATACTDLRFLRLPEAGRTSIPRSRRISLPPT
jgi:hypothetical protein